MTQRLSLDPAASLDSLPWDCVEAVGLPATSFGKAVEWQTDYVPRPVYLGRCDLPEAGELLVFGVRYEFTQRTDPPPSSGYFVRYLGLGLASLVRTLTFVISAKCLPCAHV
ncbi:MAG: hypothetical protein ABL994_20230, partial [Verrucomicrobiales bacterium]